MAEFTFEFVVNQEIKAYLEGYLQGRSDALDNMPSRGHEMSKKYIESNLGDE